MVIVNAYGDIKKQSWPYAETMEQAVPLSSIVVSPQILQTIGSEDTAVLSKIGLRLAVEDSIRDIEAYISQLALIELEFSNFKDGRPFSAAVSLRQAHRFKNDLRATGDIIPDQALFLVRAGFSSMAIPAHFNSGQFQSALSAYSLAYQPSHEDALSHIPSLRRQILS